MTAMKLTFSQTQEAAHKALCIPSGANLRKAAIAAGLPVYPVPLCGGGYANHRRSTASGRCVDCRKVHSQQRAK